MEQYNSVQQLLKKEEGHKDRKPVFPSTVIQAVFDGKTGASLEAILAQFNSIYIQYQGSPEATRNIIPMEMRRAGLTITYMNMDSETITERATSAVQKDNDHWSLNINWTRVDELSLSGDIAVSANGTWIINGEDTGVKAVGPKGDAGITPWLKTIDNKLHFSYDNVNWEPCSENIAAWFKFKATSSTGLEPSVGKFQISRDNKNWEDLSPEITNALRIAGYVATSSALPSGKPVGTIFGVGPTFAAEDTAHTNPIYRLYVYDGSKWVDNGTFTSIAAGVAQETGDSETLVMSQKATTAKLSELGSYVSNPEYARAYTDAEGKVLWGIRQDGSVEFTKGVPTSIKAYIESLDLENDEEVERINQLVIGLLADVKVLTDTYHYVSNPEWACAIVDAEERILMGIKADGSYYIPNRDMYHVESNPEYAKVVVDLEGRVLFGIKTDGSCYIPKGISEEAKKGLIELTARISWFEADENPEWIQVTTDSEGRILEGFKNDGKKYFSKQEMFEKYNDPEERTEMILDAEDRIMSYRDKDGVKYESKQHTKEASFDRMILTDSNASDIELALKKRGFTSQSPIDWSNEKFLQLPIPRTCAKVNIISDRLPTTKTDDIEAIIEFWDKDGNFFRKKVIINAQGSSSMHYKGKNISLDLDDGSKIKFGHWVAQDSFHLKLYYIDVYRGMANFCYNWCEDVIQYLQCRSCRVVMDSHMSTAYEGSYDVSIGFNYEPLCHPDGFPFEMYHNGEYYGLFAWNLKKHRANYMQDKKDATSTIIDGVLDNLFFGGTHINWSSFELRNPKELANMDGTEYNGENPQEIIDETSQYYDESNVAHKNSSTIKPIIKKLSKATKVIDGMTDSSDKKAYFNECYDRDMMICYLLCSNVLYNFDGFSKNWIWTIYNGGKAAPNFYDMDSCFGRVANGTYVYSNSLNQFIGVNIKCMATLWELYEDEIKSTYADLRRHKLIDVDFIMKFVLDWIDRVGFDTYKRNMDTMNDIPSFRENKINNEYWALNRERVVAGYEGQAYDETKNYVNGDEVLYGKGNSLKFTCQKSCINEPPLLGFYEDYPHNTGMYDTPDRIRAWLIERIAFLDEYLDYIV